MENAIVSQLKEGEKLLWFGKPAAFETVDKTYRPVLTRKIIIAVLLGVIDIAWDIIRSRASGGFGLSLLLLIPIAIIPLVPLMDAIALRDLTYAATDKRLMIIGDRVGEIAYEKISDASMKKDADGHSSLLCGKSAVNSSKGSWRRLAIASANDIINNEKQCSKFVMYGIEEPEKLEAAIKPYLSLR